MPALVADELGITVSAGRVAGIFEDALTCIQPGSLPRGNTQQT